MAACVEKMSQCEWICFLFNILFPILNAAEYNESVLFVNFFPSQVAVEVKVAHKLRNPLNRRVLRGLITAAAMMKKTMVV